MNLSNYCILLTGTIRPKNTFALERSNSSDREDDYCLAIKHWRELGIPIVFCENSNFHSPRIESYKNSEFEFLQYEEKEDLSLKGKGYGEYKLMNYAFKHSVLLKKYDYIIKITGRLYFKNYGKILNIASTSNFDIMAPLELNLKWSDSRFFIFRKSFFYDYFSLFAINIDDSKGYCFERALAGAIHAVLADNKNWEMLPCFPRWKGYSGTKNKRLTIFYNLSFIKILKFPLYRYLGRI